LLLNIDRDILSLWSCVVIDKDHFCRSFC